MRGMIRAEPRGCVCRGRIWLNWASSLAASLFTELLMAMTQHQRLGIFVALALVMAATRVHLSLFHHDIWDASWGVFFLAGFWLRGNGRWAFPLLMAEAVLVDYIVISRMGINFWTHYCVSLGYWFLVPAYGALWVGGSWLAK